ncbi:Periplasmic serine endoprotease DegP [bacterium HR39]|nr:Periplasmic serine endoprotease DegP [bacterium HR39]
MNGGGGTARRLRRFAVVAGLAAATVAAGGLGVWAGRNIVAERLEKVRAGVSFERSYADLVEAVVPAVVYVEVERKTQVAEPGEPPIPPELRRFFRRFFGPDLPFPEPPPQPRERRLEAVGSGFIIDEVGHVVTNAHVAREAERITVTLNDGTKLGASVVGIDEKTDLAVLKLESDGPFPYVEFGDSDRVRVGDKIIAVGNPFGLGGTVTAGIVSATKRELGVGPYDDFIQIDAAINRGNSGGPTFNLDGEVIGVNSMIFSPTGGNVGIGFAIAANLAKEVVAELIEKGKVERGWLGVLIQPVDEDIQKALGLPEARGALVSRVEPGSPADRAGVRPGDVIVGLDGQPVEDPRDLAKKVARAGPGHRAEIEVVREGGRRVIQVELAEMPAEMRQAAGPETGTPRGEPELGLRVAPLDEELRAQFDIPDGVSGLVVVEVDADGPAAEKGLQPGDVIAEAGGRPVKDVADLRRAIREAKEAGRAVLLLRVFRGDQPRFVAVPLRGSR